MMRPMHLPTHVLSGWCVANCVPGLTPRERLFAMVAAAMADLDGLGIVFGMESAAWWDYHHVLGHNLLFGVVGAAVLTAFSSHRGRAFALYLAAFHLHLLMDFYGSGPGWTIPYWWPFPGAKWKTDAAWALTSWQNGVAFAVLLAWTVLIAIRCGRTPVEAVAARLDRKWVDALRRGKSAEGAVSVP
jgi:hypothetical protein